jgi:glutathione S-transferase
MLRARRIEMKYALTGRKIIRSMSAGRNTVRLATIPGVSMSLTLHFHPLSSFCWKALIALYENDIPFTPNSVNLGDPTERAALLKLWPIGKFPVLRDDARGETIPETSIIIEYLDRHYRGPTRFIPDDAALALRTRLRDRFYDLYVHLPMQKIVGNRLRADANKDPHGVVEARAQLRTSYAMIEQQMAAGGWAMGGDFSLADCAAAPALFYGNRAEPLGEAHKNVRAYLERLEACPSFARVLKEAEPWFQMFPKEA